MTAFLIVSLACAAATALIVAIFGLLWPDAVIWSKHPTRLRAFITYALVALVAAACLSFLSWEPPKRGRSDGQASRMEGPAADSAEKSEVDETMEMLRSALSGDDPDLRIDLVPTGDGQYRIDAAYTPRTIENAELYLTEAAWRLKKLGDAALRLHIPISRIALSASTPTEDPYGKINHSPAFTLRVAPEDLEPAWSSMTTSDVLDHVETEATTLGQSVIESYCASKARLAQVFCRESAF